MVDVSKRYDKLSNVYGLLDAVPVISKGEYAWRRKLIEYIVPNNNEWVLEIGTGPGIMIKEAMTKYPDVCYAGIDISKKMIKIAKRNVPHAEFIVCDANNLPFKDNSISSIIYAFTLTTLPDYKGSLKESMRILKNEGKIGIMDGKKPSGKISCFIFFFIKYTAIVIGKTYFGRDVISYILNFKNLKTLFFKSFFMGMSYVMIVQIRK